MNPGAGGNLPEENRVIPILIDFVAPSREPATNCDTQPGESSFMQSPFWAHFKAKTGWKAFTVSPRSGGGFLGRDLVVLVRTLGFGFHFAYIPHGPCDSGFGGNEGVRLESLGCAIIDAIGPEIGGRILFLRFDLAWDRASMAGASLLESIDGGKCRIRRGTPVQVPDTVILDIEKPEEEILAGMKPKWRYNIKLAEKKGIEVSEEGEEALDAFYALYLETAKRDGIAIHPLSYYRTLFEMGESAQGNARETKPKLSVWLARHEGKPIASIITLFFGKRATYLYGASSGEKRNLMPAYALQWRAIQAARAEGCADYDFFGIPPTTVPIIPWRGYICSKPVLAGGSRTGSDASTIPPHL